MPYTIFSSFFLMLLFIAGYTSNGQVSNKEFKNRSELVLLAWNEDTIHNYQFSLLRNGHFAYTIIEKDGSTNAKSYYGKCGNYFSDTLFLLYNKNICPPGFVKYLVGEGDGHYLIQKFIDTPKIIFLRLQQLGHRL